MQTIGDFANTISRGKDERLSAKHIQLLLWVYTISFLTFLVGFIITMIMAVQQNPDLAIKIFVLIAGVVILLNGAIYGLHAFLGAELFAQNGDYYIKYLSDVINECELPNRQIIQRIDQDTYKVIYSSSLDMIGISCI